MTVFISILLKETWSYPSLSMEWIANLLFAFMFLSTGQLMVYGFHRLEAQTGSLIMLLEILLGIILGFLFFKEILTLNTFLGGLLIVFAIVLPQIKIKY